MKITLIRPRTGNTPDPPLGLMILSACAKQHGHSVQVIDPGADDNHFIEDVVTFGPDVAGYSLLTTQVSRARQIHAMIRKSLPGCITVAGGIHASALPEWTLRNLQVDYAIIGEAEETFVELLDRIESGGDAAEIPGVAVLRDNVFLRGPARPFIEDLDRIPFPDREGIDFKRYLRPPGNIRGKLLHRATSIITSRGCPFSCTFCSSKTLFGRHVRRRSVGNVMEEIHYLIERWKIDGLWFLDDTLLESAEWLDLFCEQMKITRLPWACQAHVRRADETVFRKMYDSGCRQLEFGVESGSERILERIRKSSRPDDVRKAFALSRAAGIRTLANFMLGVPGETEADAEMTFNLAREIKPDHVVVTFVTPLPGSALFDESLEKGWLQSVPDFSTDWIIRQTKEPAVVLAMDVHTLVKIRRKFDNYFLWTNIRQYFLYPGFVLSILFHVMLHPARYWNGIGRAVRTGRLLHIVETIWDEYNRI